jgi:hypothetical protein
MLPNVEILIENGNLGLVPTTADGVAALVVPATAKPMLPLYTPTLIFSLKDAENLGLTEANDTTETIDAWRQIKEFYLEAGNGAELYIYTYPMERSMTEICDPANTTNGVRKLLDYAEGRIRMIAIGGQRAANYVPVLLGGINTDAHSAAQNLNILAMEYMASFAPFVGLVDAGSWNGVVADLIDLHTYTYRKVGMVLASSVAGKKSACVGLCLGRLAKIPVQRNIGRVKDGAVNIPKGYMTDGKEIKKFPEGALNLIHDKGYIFFRKFNTRSGIYFNDDPTATLTTDDYLSLSNNRTIHKALIIVYNTYVDEILDEIEITDEGLINPTVVAYLENKIGTALDILMLQEGNISGYKIFIDPLQNVTTTNKIKISGHIIDRPKLKKIAFSLGFLNPNLSN